MTSKITDLEQLAGSVEVLQQEVARLNARLTDLESLLPVSAPSPTSHRNHGSVDNALNEETVVAIGAAIAAYLGVQPHIRQIRLLHNHPWGQQGRVTIQASHRIAAASS